MEQIDINARVIDQNINVKLSKLISLMTRNFNDEENEEKIINGRVIVQNINGKLSKLVVV